MLDSLLLLLQLYPTDYPMEEELLEWGAPPVLVKNVLLLPLTRCYNKYKNVFNGCYTNHSLIWFLLNMDSHCSQD